MYSTNQNYLVDWNGENISNCQNCDKIPRHFRTFSVMHLNAGSGGLRKSGQFEQTENLLHGEDSDFDALAVSETWLSREDALCYNIPGSTCTVLSSTCRSSPDGSVQIVCVRLRKLSLECCVIGLYSSSFVHHSALLDELEAVLPSCSSLPCVVAGDANVNLLAENRCAQYDGFFAAHDLYHT